MSFGYSLDSFEYHGHFDTREEALDEARVWGNAEDLVWTANLVLRTTHEIVGLFAFARPTMGYLADQCEQHFGQREEQQRWPFDQMTDKQFSQLDSCLKVALRHFFAVTDTTNLDHDFWYVTEVDVHDPIHESPV